MNVEHNKQPAGGFEKFLRRFWRPSQTLPRRIDGVVSLANTYTPIKNFLKKGSSARPSRSASMTT